ncbi:MAG: kynureninase [Acidobacteriaceae bacterium]|nr:kynureninase [Acidobacteriaceae bacterium]
MNDPLLAWRKEFPILGHTTYMISHSLGAMPRRVAERLQEFADTWPAAFAPGKRAGGRCR